jgi:hypothetical protein
MTRSYRLGWKQFGAIAIRGLHRTFLVEVTQIKIVVKIVTVRSRISGPAERRQPEAIEAGGGQGFPGRPSRCV